MTLMQLLQWLKSNYHWGFLLCWLFLMVWTFWEWEELKRMAEEAGLRKGWDSPDWVSTITLTTIFAVALSLVWPLMLALGVSYLLGMGLRKLVKPKCYQDPQQPRLEYEPR